MKSVFEAGKAARQAGKFRVLANHSSEEELYIWCAGWDAADKAIDVAAATNVLDLLGVPRIERTPTTVGDCVETLTMLGRMRHLEAEVRQLRERSK